MSTKGFEWLRSSLCRRYRCLYSPSIHLKYSKQKEEIQRRINNDVLKLEEYSINNHQPVNHKKIEFGTYHKLVQVPEIHVKYANQSIQRQRPFKYLGFHLDYKLSFNNMINAQFIKLRKSFTILKYIHQAFPAFSLKKRVFQTYTLTAFIQPGNCFLYTVILQSGTI